MNQRPERRSIALPRISSSPMVREMSPPPGELVNQFSSVCSGGAHLRCFLLAFVAVGTPVTRRPPHRSRRAVFPHRALQLDTSFVAHRKVCQCNSVSRTALVACVSFVLLLAPSPASGLSPCCWLRWANPTPGGQEALLWVGTSLPAWPSQLVRQGLSGSPSFQVLPSARATLLDPGKPSSPSPLTGQSVLDSSITTSCPLACDALEAELLKLDAGPACGSRFAVDTLLDSRSFPWPQRSTGCPSAEQSSVFGGWLDLTFISEP